VRPGSGTISIYEPPGGPGVRTDGFGYVGYRTSNAFDSLLAKVIVHSPSDRFADAVRRTRRALGEFRLEGVSTNIQFLRTIMGHPDFENGHVHTRWLDQNIATLAESADALTGSLTVPHTSGT
jgi:pyruvate carboxylase